MLELIVATTKNNAIGKNGKMMWHLPADLKWFKEKTLGKVVVMGRKTFESIGKPLSERTNIVLTRNPPKQKIKGVEYYEFLMDAVRDYAHQDIVLIGGGEVYKRYLILVDTIYLTQIQTEMDGDTFFPELNWNEWNIEFEEYRKADRNNKYDCRFFILKRVKK